MDKESQTNPVHHLGFGKGQSLADKACQALAQRVVPALDMRGLTGVFATSCMLFVRDHLLISLPKIRVAVPVLISRRDCVPQLAAGLLAPVADDKGHHLARRAR